MIRLGILGLWSDSCLLSFGTPLKIKLVVAIIEIMIISSVDMLGYSWQKPEVGRGSIILTLVVGRLMFTKTELRILNPKRNLMSVYNP